MSMEFQPDTAAGVEFLKRFFAGTHDAVELRALPSADRVFTRVPKEIVTFLTKNQREDIYFGVATRNGGGTKEHCRELVAFYCDVDQGDDAMKRIEAFTPEPSIINCSGGGFHLYWLLETPIDAQDPRVEPILEGICDALKADPACAERARVLRVPGTWNFKPEYPEPQQVFTVRENWNSRYAVRDFLPFVTVTANGNGKHAAAPPIAEDVPPGSRNNTLTSLAGTLKRRNASLAAIEAALIAQNQTWTNPLPEAEVRAIANSINRYPAGSPRPETSTQAETGEVSEDRLTEAGAAERFVRCHGGDVRYDHRRNHWLMWQGQRWKRDADEAITRLALKFARTWQRESVEISDSRKREETFKAAGRLERHDALASMFSFAGKLLPVADAGAEWDADPNLLGVRNGVVDLRTGELRPGRHQDKITMQSGVPYDPAADCPRFRQFIAEIFNDDADLISFVKRDLGYCITGNTAEQCLVIAYGTGSNGKSTLINIVKRILGDYAWNMPFGTVELQSRASIPNDLAALVGRRFVCASETNEGTRLNESRIKMLTGGDPVTARFLHGEFFEFEPVAKFWLSVNHKPTVREDSHSFWRRIRLIPFTRTFPLNAALADQLWSEASGILNWMVEGCLDWQREGLNSPDAVLSATAEYKQDSDQLAPFLAETCELDPSRETPFGELFAAYKAWAEGSGFSEKERLTVTMFGRKLGERFQKRRIDNKQKYRGVSLV